MDLYELALASLAADGRGGSLGDRRALLGAAAEAKPSTASLRKHLQRLLVKDSSFVPTSPEDDQFRALDARVSPDIAVIVAGHTHLERALPRERAIYGWLGSRSVSLWQSANPS